MRLNKIRQFLDEAACAALWIEVILEEAEVAESKISRRIGEEVLGDDVEQRRVAGEPLQVGHHSHIFLRYPGHCQQIFEHPREDVFYKIIPVFFDVEEQGIVDPILDIDILGDLHNVFDDLRYFACRFGVEVFQQLFVFHQAFGGFDVDNLIFNAEGDMVFHKFDFEPQFFQHGEQYTRIFKCPDAPIKHKAVFGEGIDQSPAVMFFFQQQHAGAVFRKVGGCGQA